MSVCRICKESAHHEEIFAREMVHGTRETFRYALCGACGTLSLEDPPADLSPYYQNYYSTAAVENGSSGSKLRRALLPKLKRWSLRTSILGNSSLSRYLYRRKAISWLAWGPMFRELRSLGVPVSLQTRFLDVGSGSGQALSQLADAGFTSLTGCDPFIAADVHLASGGKILKADIAQVEGAFDLVMFHHSLEHVPDPAAALKSAAALLASAGVVVLRFPNIASPEFLKFKSNWWGIHAPRHFFLLSQSAVRIIAHEAGLEILHTYCDSTFDHYLYSSEYALNIDDHHPLSFRADSVGLWTPIELENARQRARLWNSKKCGDWVTYVLHRSK